ncbi:type VI secretion system membrane subunit TssM [Helicobacter saguini]|uniref:Type VI secretion system membrane subunit TssM n=1 Tax=Helicobacter saguini TaxID=1548018 RepID=A0A347VQ48_9HELI|nr:type VI secretion system membrane subunit TssM [Helicobacter saguini]MWV61081.1 type VI secretion system membrane subunit TssM [Helicobacter saguini]MWV68250.1 type VI secretion system membrane subunit TssM [Helicobacter saguini]MWV70286.1 type VI secretion system membrane subunit TssM [Helicobacter saguini]MWV72188.1 type VI secretion system membrane subunit TssM [Helicobacter saguini]TLD95243.1 type VI secretion system membrane subunit TssM [Helicobacter saguini]
MFKKIFNFLFSKKVLICVGLLTLLILSVLFFLYGSLFAFNDIYIFSSSFIRLGIIFVVWIIVFLVFFLQETIEFIQSFKNEDKEKLKEIKKESKSFIHRMRRNFKLSIKDSKNTWKYMRLKSIPLVVIIGNEGVGKSTLINYANIDYPLNDSLESYKKFHHSTTNFSLYISKDGALVDTEGNYFNQEELFNPASSDEMPEDDLDKNKDYIVKKNIWKKFISFLNKNIFYNKLNAIILVIDTRLFLTSDVEYSKNLARYLVKRVSEIENNTDTKFPIYLVFSKIDLIDGMGDYLRIFSEDVANNVLGISLQDSINLDSNILHNEFSILMQNLQYYLFSKNNLIHSLDEKNKAYLFLKQLENLFFLASEFALLANKENILKNKSFIKGIYFVSPYQENIPINYLYDAICDKFDIKKPINKARNNYTKQSYFVKSLLKNVIFKDLSASGVLKQLWKKVAVTCVIICTIFITYKISSFYINKTNVEIEIANNNAKKILNLMDMYRIYDRLSIEAKVRFLQNLKGILDSYPELFKKDSINNYITLDISYKAFENAKDMYIESINKLLKDTLIIELESKLKTTQDSKELIKTLYIYKSLFDSTYLDKELLKIWLLNNYESFKKYKIPQEDLISCINNIHFQKNKENKEISLFASEKILRIPRIERLYTILEITSYKNNKKILYNLKDDIGLGFDILFTYNDNLKFDSIYTKKGVERFLININKYVDNSIDIESWLLKDFSLDSINDKVAINIGLINLYFHSYVEKWQILLDNLEPKKYNTKEEMIMYLNTLAKNPITTNTMYNLISIVNKNTNLNDPLIFTFAYNLGLPTSEIKNIFNNVSSNFTSYHTLINEDSMIDNIAQKASPKKDSNNTQNNQTKDSNILEIISKDIAGVSARLSEYLNQSDNKKERITYAFSKNLPKEDAFSILRKDINALPKELRKYYNTAISNVWNLIELVAIQDLNTAWSDEVYYSFMNDIAPYYPFNLKSNDSISMDNFKGFFGKSGTWSKFYEQYLQNILLKKGSVYYINPSYINKIRFSSEFISAITNIATLADIMFDLNSNLRISYNITSIDLSPEFNYITFGYDNVIAKYDHTLQSKLDVVASNFKAASLFEFSATNHNNIVEFSKKYDGEWAWFKFLKDITKTKKGYSMIFNNNNKMYFDIKIDSSDNLDKLTSTLPNFSIPLTIIY